MSNEARVVATLDGQVRHPAGTADYFTTVMIAYTVLVGSAYRSAKYPVEVTGAKNEADYRESVKEALVAELKERWPADNFKTRDVMLFGL